MRGDAYTVNRVWALLMGAKGQREEIMDMQAAMEKLEEDQQKYLYKLIEGYGTREALVSLYGEKAAKQINQTRYRNGVVELLVGLMNGEKVL